MGLEIAPEIVYARPLEAGVQAHKALLRAAEELQTQLDEQGILRVIAMQLAGVVPYNEGLSVYLLAPSGVALQPVYADGPFAADVLAEPPTSIECGISGAVACSGQARIENDALHASDARVVEGTSEESQNLLAVPLRSRTRVLGVLLLYRSLDWPFVHDDLDLVQLFANQAAIAIENASLYGAAIELADGLQTAQNIATRITRLTDVRAICDAIGDELARLLSYDAYRVFLHDHEPDELVEIALGGPAAEYTKGNDRLRLRVGEGVTGWVAQHREPEIVNDLNHDPRAKVVPGTADDVDESLLAVPLNYEDRLLGVITVTRRGVNQFRPSHLRVLTILGGQVATAIENARLLQRERERANALEELDRLRADFVSTVSHELRTPLTSIIGFTENLQSYWPRMADEKKREMVGKITLSSQRLERFVRDLLFMSHVESGNLPLHIEPVDVAALAAAAVQEIEGKYHGEHIRVEAPARPVSVLADRDRLCQVVVNLLDNAIKYSPEGYPVTIRWDERERHVALSVRDQGRGIATADMPRLFTRFGKIGTAVRAGQSGTGLGLYISRGLIEGMNGCIAVESTPGDGSTFSVTVPLAPATASESRPRGWLSLPRQNEL